MVRKDSYDELDKTVVSDGAALHAPSLLAALTLPAVPFRNTEHNSLTISERTTEQRKGETHSRQTTPFNRDNPVIRNYHPRVKVVPEDVTISFHVLIAQPLENQFCDQDQDGDNELMLAIIKENDQYAILIIEILTKRKSGHLLNLQNDSGHTAAHLAVKVDLINVTKALVSAGVDLTIRDHNGDTPLHCACELGRAQHVCALTEQCEKNVDKNALILQRQRLQRITFETGSLSQADNVSAKDNAELLNYRGLNSLHLAAIGGHIEIIEHLVDIGVDVNKPGGGRGMTALHYAVQACDVTMVLFLIKGVKANVNVVTLDGWSAVDMAIGYKHDLLSRVLLKHGACHSHRPTTSNDDDDDDE